MAELDGAPQGGTGLTYTSVSQASIIPHYILTIRVREGKGGHVRRRAQFNTRGEGII